MNSTIYPTAEETKYWTTDEVPTGAGWRTDEIATRIEIATGLTVRSVSRTSGLYATAYLDDGRGLRVYDCRPIRDARWA